MLRFVRVLRRSTTFVAVSSVAFGTACAKVDDCRRTARTVNAAVTEIEAVRADGLDVREVQGIAARYELLADEIKALGIGTPRIARLTEEYETLYRRASRGARAMAEAQTAENERALVQNRRELERVVAQERVLAVRFNAVCEAP